MFPSMLSFRSSISAMAVLLFGLMLGCDRRSQSERKLIEAIGQGDTNYVQKYLSIPGNVSKPIQYLPFGRVLAPPLHLAARSVQLEVVDQLLRAGANPNQHNTFGETPLLWAISHTASHNDIQIIKRLIDSGAEPDGRSGSVQDTPLIRASRYGNLEAVKFLLAAGADVRATNLAGFTPLHLATTAEVAETLIQAGASVMCVTTEKETPADTAQRLNHLDALKVITNAIPKKS